MDIKRNFKKGEIIIRDRAIQETLHPHPKSREEKSARHNMLIDFKFEVPT
jgi:hypothetical protein